MNSSSGSLLVIELSDKLVEEVVIKKQKVDIKAAFQKYTEIEKPNAYIFITKKLI